MPNGSVEACVMEGCVGGRHSGEEEIKIELVQINLTCSRVDYYVLIFS